MGCLNSTPAQPVPVAAAAKSQKKPSTSADYERVQILGMGASCNVMIAEHKATKKQYALKVLRKAGADAADSKKLFDNEVKILQTLHHPNIIEFVEAFEEEASCTIVTGLCRGGELFDRISQGVAFTERTASALIKQLLLALAHCHERNISHRDIKPENLIYETPAQDSNVKLIDFGCALLSPDTEIVDDVAGSPYYVAPEVLDHAAKRTGATWKASDMWSVGVIIYLIVFGYPPFNGERQELIFAKIKAAKYKWNKNISISDACKDLISKMLVRDPSQRITSAQALQHPWIREPARLPDIPISAEVIKSLGEFRSACKLRKAVAKATVNMLTEKEKVALAEMFKKYDVNGDGRLSADEISAMMKDLGKEPAEMKLFMQEADDNNDGTISPDEFMAAAAATRIPSEVEAKQAFDAFDVDGDGMVTHEEIERLCSGMSPEVAKQLIAEVDKNGDGQINFSEWLAAMQAKK